MRLLFLGDVMGRSGRDAINDRLPGLIEQYKFDFVVVNGENASHGKGLTEPHFNAIRHAGADVVTLGDHAFDQRETISYIERENTLIRPINMPPGTPGRGAMLVSGRNGHSARWSPPSPPVPWASRPMPSSSTSIPRRPRKSRPWGISSTAR